MTFDNEANRKELELKQALQDLAQSETRLRYVLDATQEGIWDWDVSSGLVTHNQQWCLLVGLDDGFLQHPLDDFAALLHPDDLECVFDKIQQCLRGEKAYQSEHRMLLRNGQIKWVFDRGDVVERDSEGKPLRMVGSIAEITERHQAVARLQDRNEQLNVIFELSPDGFVSFDRCNCIKYANPAFLRMTGFSLESVAGLSAQDFREKLATAWRVDNLFQEWELVSANQNNSAIDLSTVQSSNGKLVELGVNQGRVLEFVLRRSSAETISHIMYFRDVTREIEIDRMKSEFLATAAHELRTPMASVLGFAEVLLNTKVADHDAKEYLEIIYSQSKVITFIINDLLDLARIESRGKSAFEFKAWHLTEVLQEVLNTYPVPTDRHTPLVELLNHNDLVYADRFKLIQALNNVINNAYKYSPNGGDIQIKLLHGGADGQFLGIQISDAGLGMSEQQLARIYERFYRADVSGKIPGTGLGMSIVKEIIEWHSGYIDIVSQLGVGTSMTLWIPAYSAQSVSLH